MAIRFTGLAPEHFASLFALSDEDLAARGIRRVVADEKPGFPCRVSLEDAAAGETLLLLPFEHQPASSPYRASGPIFVRQQACEAADIVDRLPEVLHGRLISVRAYDGDDLMVDAEVVPGSDAIAVIERFFARDDVSYIHLHNAKRGCYAARVDRV
jgi:hypothetical protein